MDRKSKMQNVEKGNLSGMTDKQILSAVSLTSRAVR